MSQAQKTNSVWLSLRETLKVVKFTETESRVVVAGGLQVGEGAAVGQVQSFRFTGALRTDGGDAALHWERYHCTVHRKLLGWQTSWYVYFNAIKKKKI